MIELGVCLAAMALIQDPQADLQAVVDAEQKRVAVMEQVTPAVCSVMGLNAPGGGSGVIIDPLGFVLTNFHVVGKPDVKRMKIGLPGGDLQLATVLGVDPGSDLAILLIDPKDDDSPWPAAPLGDSDALLVGETVFAMGNPFLLATDFQPTTTWGLVSGTHRYQPGPGNRALVYPDCIQVDVPINPGNSGGPLFNMSGEIVGINGRISVRDRGRVNVGVGFAIASNQIKNFLGDLMAGRFTEHGTLDMNAWFMKAPKDDRHGVYVQGIFADSKVTSFGLALGDELTQFNGEEIKSANQLATRVGVLPAGAWISLGFRPQNASGGHDDEKLVEFTLHRLDTGSSRNPERIANAEHRKLALRALARPIGQGKPADGAIVVLRGPADRVVTVQRLGDRLRIDDGAIALVLTGAGEGFRLESDKVTDLSPEELAKLERVLSTNPWLWRGPQLQSRIEGGLLTAGTMVHGRAGFRVELDGDGQREIFFLLDGTPAGCRYRDPVQKALVELRAIGGKTRLVVDDELRPGWTIAAPQFTRPASTLFERPTR